MYSIQHVLVFFPETIACVEKIVVRMTGLGLSKSTGPMHISDILVHTPLYVITNLFCTHRFVRQISMY